MRFASDDVRDHIVCRKNDYEPSYALYGASLRWKSPKIDFREIFGVDRFSLLQHNRGKSRHGRSTLPCRLLTDSVEKCVGCDAEISVIQSV